MNWKNSFIVLCLFSSLSWASGEARHYQTYQRLLVQLQKDPVATLAAIELFTKQAASADDQSKQMAAYLQLQACITLNRYRCAAKAVETLLALNQDETRKPELLKLSAQLHYQTQRYNTVINNVQQWLNLSQSQEVSPPAKNWAEMYSLQAYGQFYLQAYRPAIAAIERAIKHQKTEQRELFALGLYQQQKDWRNVNRVLKSLVSAHAYKAEYWEKYAYSFLKLDQQKQALHALGSAYKAGNLPQRSIILYAQMLLRFNAPDRAVNVLEAHPNLASNAIYNSLLTQSYLLARDKENAAKWLAKSTQKDADITRGLLAYQQGQWQQVVTLFSSLDAAKKRNHYWLLLAAISEFELQRWQQARVAFERLAGTHYDELATQWLSQIEYLTSK